ncbi:MAG TPA: glycosyltransferase family 2 protein [Puia sp.]|nr:glycosyltransferase family 2 protein [Puia sp.]
MSKELQIVVPVYNEETSLKRLIDDWRNLLDNLSLDYQFLFIDDGSTDHSLDLLQTYRHDSPDILVYSQPNAGHGPAILNGYTHACQAHWVLQIDSDHQLTPNSFPEFWHGREDYDLILGNRKEKNASTSRRLISNTSRSLTRILFGGRSPNDVNCPYRLFRGPALVRALPLIPPDSFAPNVLLTAWFIRNHMRIRSIPVPGNDAIPIKKSELNGYFLRGSIRALWQTLLFRFRS